MAHKHTPGPWRVDYKYIIAEENTLVAEVYYTDHRRKDDLSLIAAAPELLTELKHLVRLMEPLEETGLNIPGLATLNGARAAIAKAEGRA